MLHSSPRWRTRILYAVAIYASLVIFGLGLLWILAAQAPQPATNPGLTKWINNADAPVSRPFSGVMVPKTAPSIGSPDAKITIIEFSDFQCPFCKASSYVMRQVINEFGADIYYVYRHFPIEYTHALAMELAHASMCAQEQGKFWQIHDRFFQYQDAIKTQEDIDAQAEAVGLSMREYNNCTLSQRWQDEINTDLSDVIQLGGRGTPTWMVNGNKIEGHLTFEAWRQIITSLR